MLLSQLKTAREEESEWRDYYNNGHFPSVLSAHLGDIEEEKEGEKEGEKEERCGLLGPVWGGWIKWKCSVTKERRNINEILFL